MTDSPYTKSQRETIAQTQEMVRWPNAYDQWKPEYWVKMVQEMHDDGEWTPRPSLKKIDRFSYSAMIAALNLLTTLKDANFWPRGVAVLADLVDVTTRSEVDYAPLGYGHDASCVKYIRHLAGQDND